VEHAKANVAAEAALAAPALVWNNDHVAAGLQIDIVHNKAERGLVKLFKQLDELLVVG